MLPSINLQLIRLGGAARWNVQIATQR